MTNQLIGSTVRVVAILLSDGRWLQGADVANVEVPTVPPTPPAPVAETAKATVELPKPEATPETPAVEKPKRKGGRKKATAEAPANAAPEAAPATPAKKRGRKDFDQIFDIWQPLSECDGMAIYTNSKGEMQLRGLIEVPRSPGEWELLLVTKEEKSIKVKDKESGKWVDSGRSEKHAFHRKGEKQYIVKRDDQRLSNVQLFAKF